MRRQARISAGGTLLVRSASALQVWLWLLIFIFQNEFRISRSIQPGYLDFDNLPETNFTCAGKVIGGYYADLETSCQMFHVCTVGQQDEPMDIKFLCLNGTVFDQETRVCERVDEVDCTKSEKFYSLNLELYGSTLAPPIVSTEDSKKTQSTEQSVQKTKPSQGEPDPSLDKLTTTPQNKGHEHSTEIIDSTEDPIQDIKKEDHKGSHNTYPTHQSLPLPTQEDIGDEYQEEEIDENPDYEEDYSHSPTSTTVQSPTTTSTSTTTKPPPTTTAQPKTTSPQFLSPIPLLISAAPSPTVSSVRPSSSSASAPSLQSIDPALLSPQEFIYRHRGPGSEAISFQRQSIRPADGVYITHAPPQQFDHFQYESSRTAPRPSQQRPVPFVQRPPAPFRPTTLDPRDQLLRPGPASQSSERHETAIKHRPPQYPSVLPAQRPLPFNPYYYDRKRSDDSLPENESSLAARSVAPPTVTERPPTKPKSPPRVIVTASASVSDSNGKRLNYTVGNVVSAVKPIVPINYDDYKESDLIFDPFFLDVPKLQTRRKTRSNQKRRIFTVPSTATVSQVLIVKGSTSTSSPVTSRATTTERSSTVKTTPSTSTAAWNPNDYVDDNYEPHAYIPPEPIAVLVAKEKEHSFKKQEKPSKHVVDDEIPQQVKLKLDRVVQVKPTSSAVQTTSSQIEGAGAAPPTTTALPAAPSCATHSSNCRTRA